MAPPDGQSRASALIEYLILVIVGAVGIILMLVAAGLRDFWSKVLSDLGGALVIAALVGLFVELRLLKRATEQMVAAGMKATEEMVSAGRTTTEQMVAAGTKTVRDIYTIIGGGLRKYISAEKVDALQNAILYPPILRQGMNILITLTRAQTVGRLKGTVSLKYYVRNLKSEQQRYLVRMGLDEKYGEGSADLASAKINRQDIDLSHLPEGTTLSRESKTLIFEHAVQIPSESAIYVELKGFQMMAEEDLWPWNLLSVADSVTITVNYPPEFLNVYILPNHPSKVRIEENLGTKQATIDDVIVPYQGFEIKWELSQTSPTAEPAQSAGPRSPSAAGQQDKKP